MSTGSPTSTPGPGAGYHPAPPAYNDILEKLVAGNEEPETHLRGFVAYVYYKLAKREWVEGFFNQNGRQPNQQELQAYIGTWTASRIDGVVTEANNATSQFASYIIAQAKPDIVKEALQEKSFWREAFVAFVGALMYTVALILFAFLLKFAHVDVISIFQNVGVPTHSEPSNSHNGPTSEPGAR